MYKSWQGRKKLVFFFPLLSAVFLIFPPVTELIQVDSPSYIDFHVSRTIGYPAFLWLIKKVPGNLHCVPFIQLALYAGGCSFLAQRLYQLKPTRLGLLLTLVATSLIMLHPEIIKYHFQAMSESFSLSILLFLLGLWIDFTQNKHPQTLATISLLIGVGILLRPSGYASISLLLLALWLLGKEAFYAPHRWLSALVVPLALMIFLGSAANFLVHGFWGTQSFLGHTLIGKVTFIMRENVITPEPEKYKQLYQAVVPIQQVVDGLPNPQTRQLLRAPYYDVVRYQITGKIFPPDHDWNVVWRDMAFAVIKDNPAGYFKDILENYTALWIYPQATSYENAAQFLKHFEAIRPLPYMDHYPFTLRGVPAWFALFFHLCFTVALFISFYSLVGALVAPRHRWIAMAAGGSWLIHSHYLLTACVQAGLTRYAISLWPAIVVICIIFLMQWIHYFSNQQD
jgi:hypothetical protein